MVTGLDNLAEREEAFILRLQGFRAQLRDELLAVPRGAQRAAELERDLDGLLMEAANLAREPMLRHMAKITEAATTLSLTPRMHVVYPDPRKGAEAVNPNTPDLANVLTRMVTDYLAPKPYASRFGGQHRLPAGALHWQGPSRMSAFVNDVIHLVDNPHHIPPKEPRNHE